MILIHRCQRGFCISFQIIGRPEIELNIFCFDEKLSIARFQGQKNSQTYHRKNMRHDVKLVTGVYFQRKIVLKSVQSNSAELAGKA